MICIINFRLLLCIAITLGIFRTEGNCPVKKHILKISLNSCEISIFGSFKFSQVYCLAHDLWESSGDIIENISFLSVKDKKNVFVFVLDRC